MHLSAAQACTGPYCIAFVFASNMIETMNSICMIGPINSTHSSLNFFIVYIACFNIPHIMHPLTMSCIAR